ncbi:MAG TPA: aminoglycoside phosphotransferase family protein, partial [Nitrospirota bacterium]
ARLRAEGVPDPGAITPALIRNRNGRTFHRDDSGAYWRMFHFIESGAVFDTVRNAGHAYEIGRGLGGFQALVSDLSPERLHDTLPGFHRTPIYLDQFDDALRADPMKRASEVREEALFVSRRRQLAPLITSLMESGQIPVRVAHNDPKVNNIMVAADTGKALCMLDLDTVKPGTVLFDFGDCVRSAANPAGEDAEDLANVRIDLALFEAITRGYLSEARSFLTLKEIGMLTPSVKVITFELGIRFLADYLRGDTYFKIKYPSHNLHRCRVQFRLLESIESDEGRMSSFVAQCAASC